MSKPASAHKCSCPGASGKARACARGGRFALLGTTVAPGFDYADYQTADRAHLLTIHPTAHTLITALTPD